MNAEQLKASILQQAIEGKLVPQLAEEGVVEQIGAAPEEVPFEIPEKWKWEPAGVLFDFIRGVTFPASAKGKEQVKGTIRCLTTGSVQVAHNTMADVFIPTDYVKKERQYLVDNDIVISSANSRELVGKNILWHQTEETVTFGGFLTVARIKNEQLDATYAYFIFQALFTLHFFENLSTQTTNIANLSNTLLTSVLIPVPPLQEQARIVAKIEELLPLVEDYGKSYDRLQELNAELPKKLKASILQEAIQGKLVPQLAAEGVVEQIGAAPEEVPFEIPESWKWVQLKSIGQIIGGGTPKTSVADYWNGDISWITPADLGKNTSKWILNGAKSITQKGLDESSAKLMPEGSIIYSSRAPIGHIAIAAHELCTNQGCKSFVPYAQFITTEWAYYMLIARTRDIQSRASGTTFKEISGKGVGETWVSLPPIAEQQRIVAKVEELLKQVDTLSA